MRALDPRLAAVIHPPEHPRPGRPAFARGPTLRPVRRLSRRTQPSPAWFPFPLSLLTVSSVFDPASTLISRTAVSFERSARPVESSVLHLANYRPQPPAIPGRCNQGDPLAQ